jgi:iron-sulfur cluster repair protein YtfE (RIC family)
MNRDGIDILVEDHRRCEALFARLEDQEVPDTDVVHDLVRELAMHDAIESQCMYPLVIERIPGGRDAGCAAIEAHTHIASLLAELHRRNADDPHRRTLLATIAEEVAAHVQKEERSIFPALRERLAPEELLRLGDALTTARRKAPTRPHPHSPRFSVGTKVVAATLRPVDRLRDALGRHH